MKEKQKSYANFLDFNSQLTCTKHHYLPPCVGICPYCLNDRLMKLVCSDCGELRVSSCFCSEISSTYRNSCSHLDAGRRISFLIQNDNLDTRRRSFFLRSSSSSSAQPNKSNGFSRIKRLFTKRGNKGRAAAAGFPDENTCFRSGEAQYGSSKGDILDGENWFGRRNQMEVDETGFIELKLNDSWCHQDYVCSGRASVEEEIVAGLRGNGICGNKGGGSCRITMNEKGFKQGTTNWKWISKFR